MYVDGCVFLANNEFMKFAHFMGYLNVQTLKCRNRRTHPRERALRAFVTPKSILGDFNHRRNTFLIELNEHEIEDEMSDNDCVEDFVQFL